MASNQQPGDQSRQPQSQQGDARRPADYDKVGPLSIDGVEASDLPDKGRGDVFTNIGKEAARKLPQQTGDMGDGQTGLRGDPDVAKAHNHGGRGKN